MCYVSRTASCVVCNSLGEIENLLMTPKHVKTFDYLLWMALAQTITWPMLMSRIIKKACKLYITVQVTRSIIEVSEEG